MSKPTLSLLLAGLVVAHGCGQDAPPPPAPSLPAAAPAASPVPAQMPPVPAVPAPAPVPGAPPPNLAQGLEQMQKALQMFQQTQGAAAEPVPYQDLKALLPESVEGFARGEVEGETAGMQGMRLSRAEVEFAGAGPAKLEVKIIDAGGMAGMIAAARMAWGVVDISRESDHGHERTISIQGHRAFEVYDRRSERAEVKVLVADRFLVEVTGRHTAMDVVKRVAEGLRLAELAAKAGYGVAAGGVAPTGLVAPAP